MVWLTIQKVRQNLRIFERYSQYKKNDNKTNKLKSINQLTMSKISLTKLNGFLKIQCDDLRAAGLDASEYKD